MFGHRHRRQQAGSPQRGPMPEIGQPTVAPSRDLAEAAPLYTVPTPYDVIANHEPVIVYVTESGPAAEHATMQLHGLERLAKEASRLGCDGVYAIQQSMAATNGQLFITILGTGARPITDQDHPAGARAM